MLFIYINDIEIKKRSQPPPSRLEITDLAGRDCQQRIEPTTTRLWSDIVDKPLIIDPEQLQVWHKITLDSIDHILSLPVVYFIKQKTEIKELWGLVVHGVAKIEKRSIA